MSFKIGKKMKKAKKGLKKLGQKATLGLGNVVANEGKVSVAVGKVLRDQAGTENIGETLISTGRVEKHTGRGLKKIARGDMEAARNQSAKSMTQARKIDLEKVVLATKEAEVIFA